MHRKQFLRHAAIATAVCTSILPTSVSAFSFAASNSVTGDTRSLKPNNDDSSSTVISSNVAYRSLKVDISQGVEQASVPVAIWYPITNDVAVSSSSIAKYSHRISVKRIGQLLAGWEFIPEFASKDFSLSPTLSSDTTGMVVSGENMELPTRGPVVLLAHGYLGSRFDLSHLGEELASQGFICLSPEYPESLSASYPRIDGIDRSVITSRLLETITSDWGISASSYGIIGHSLGCGTAINTGDDSWARVCIGGFPRSVPRESPILFLSSMNDGAVSMARRGLTVPREYVQLKEDFASSLVASSPSSKEKWPKKASLIFDRPDAPNHISFLADSVNDSMINLLSPLLPVAQALSIPVLDFDKYKDSRDSKQTAQIVIPIVTSYLKQYMTLN
eukprot:scaffold11660_cov49-Attheya_sp.AAC.2